MPIPFTCPHCGHATAVDEQYAGQTGPCSACGKSVTIPGVAQAAAATAYAPPSGASSGKNVVIIVLAVVLLVALLCGGLLVAMLLPAVAMTREAARQAQCQNNLKQIALALNMYESKWQSLPPAYVADEQGRPKHSWRVLILRELDHAVLYDRYDFDEPWDSPGNLEVARQMPAVFECPSAFEVAEPGEPGLTHYKFVTGPNTLFQGDVAPIDQDIRDGRSLTLLAVESPQAVVWTQPQDLAAEDLDSLTAPELDSNHSASFGAAMCDGSCRRISKEMDSQTLKFLVTPRGGEVIMPGQLQ